MSFICSLLIISCALKSINTIAAAADESKAGSIAMLRALGALPKPQDGFLDLSTKIFGGPTLPIQLTSLRGLADLPEKMSITKLWLALRPVKDGFDELQQCTALRTLDLFCCGLANQPDLSPLTRLVTLNLTGNPFTEFTPANLPPHLEELIIRDSKFGNVHGQLPRTLRVLDLRCLIKNNDLKRGSLMPRLTHGVLDVCTALRKLSLSYVSCKAPQGTVSDKNRFHPTEEIVSLTYTPHGREQKVSVRIGAYYGTQEEILTHIKECLAHAFDPGSCTGSCEDIH